MKTQEQIQIAVEKIKKESGCIKVFVGPTYFLRIYNEAQIIFIRNIMDSNISIFANLLNNVLDTKESDLEILHDMYVNAIDSLD